MAQSVAKPTKEGRKKPNGQQTALLDPQLRRLRALQIIQQRIAGASRKDIAASLNVSIDTIKRETHWAKNNNLLEDAEERLLGNLLTKAMNVAEMHLDEGNLDAAKEVFKIFLNANQQKAKREDKAEDRDFDLESYFRDRRQGAITVESTPVAPEGAPVALLQGRHGGTAESTPAGAASEAGQDAGEDVGADDRPE